MNATVERRGHKCAAMYVVWEKMHSMLDVHFTTFTSRLLSFTSIKLKKNTSYLRFKLGTIKH